VDGGLAGGELVSGGVYGLFRWSTMASAAVICSWAAWSTAWALSRWLGRYRRTAAHCALSDEALRALGIFGAL